MGGACDTCRGEDKICTRFWWRNTNEGDYLEYLGIDWRVILEQILMKQGGRIQNARNFLTIWGLEGFQDDSSPWS